MADYSGHFDPWNVYFRPERGPSYWMSSKTFGEVQTRVPKDYKHLLDAVIADKIKRLYIDKDADMIPNPKVSFDEDKQEWVLHGYAWSWGGRETEAFLGWENPCKHEQKRTVGTSRDGSRGEYEWCSTCSTTFCNHDSNYVIKHYGEENWFCRTCGTEIEEDEIDVGSKPSN